MAWIMRSALVLGGVAVLAVSWRAARRLDVGWRERRAFRAINGLPNWLHWPLWPVMQCGSLVGGLLVAAGVGFATDRWRAASLAAAAVVLAWLLAKVVKARVGRGRPEAHFPDPVLREKASGLGFVSGHTAVAFALATVTFPVLGPFGEVAALSIAGVVGIARIYVGAHLPLDVVGGAGLGVIAGVAVIITYLAPYT